MKKTINIDKTPLGQKAANIIRQRIVEGIYSQGSRLIEEELASEFGISRVCVRDAFLMLEAEGMVERERNKYTKVLKFKQSDIENLFKFRLALELLAVETCIEKNCVPKEKMKQCIKTLHKVLDKSVINSLDFVEADLNFHEAIIASAGNTYVINIFKSIKYQLMTLLFSLYNMFQQEFSVQGVDQHNHIIEYMEKGDTIRAQEFLKDHIKNNLDYVMQLNERAEPFKEVIEK
jgi:DNA-binding GntR family transcriptional regulator